MPESRITTALNGTNGVTAAKAKSSNDRTDADRYRPDASTTKVHDEILASLTRVVSEALSNAGSFVYLAAHYDRDATTAVRYGHLVDACECVEIGMTHLGQLKAAMNHRLRTEDEHNLGEPRF